MGLEDGRVSVPAPPYDVYLQDKDQVQRDSKADVMDLEQAIVSPGEADETAFSIDDLEVAKALTGLREGANEPAWRDTTENPASPRSTVTMTSATYTPSQAAASGRSPEPLLSLLTAQHPLLASTINNSISAYSSSKTYSTRFRQGAEFLERNIASPVATTMETAGRISGVETGMRWMLRRNDSDPSGEQDVANKRRRLDSDEMDIERHVTSPDGMRRSRAPSDLSSTDYLPAYDDNRSPMYEENAVFPQERAINAQSIPQNWQTRLMITTSGLGVAMSEESLRSLKYCLSWLRWANTHLTKVLHSLQSVLREWDQSQQPDQVITAPNSPPLSPSSRTLPSPHSHPRDPATITQNLSALKAEIVRTLKSALDIVSTYAGGALPENARVLVRKHLTSLPLRFQLASSNAQQPPNSRPSAGLESMTPVSSGAQNDTAQISDTEAQSGTPEAVSGARRVVVLAREGLDMMTQVGAVVDGTIVSAEEWCDRLGRKRESQPAMQGQGQVQMQMQMEMQLPEKQPLTAEAQEEQMGGILADGVEKQG